MSFGLSGTKWGWVVIGAIVATLVAFVLTLIVQFGYGLVLGFRLRGSPPQEMLIAAFLSPPFLIVEAFTGAIGALVGVRMAARRSEGGAQLAGLIGGVVAAVLVLAQRAARGYPSGFSIWTALIFAAAVLGGWLAGLLAARRARAIV
jgi:hypothetical protein